MPRAILAIINMAALALVAFCGEPPVFYASPQTAAEALSHWNTPFEFSGMATETQLSTFRPERVEQSALAKTEGRYAVIFARAERVAIHGGFVKVALLALLEHKRAGWQIIGVPERFQAYGAAPEVTFTYHEADTNPAIPRPHLVVKVNDGKGQSILNFALSNGKVLQIK
jgi:hypothetical protein